MKDFYDVLDISVTATPEEIKAKYRQLVRIYHPDRFSNPVDKQYAEQKLKELNVAYSALTVNPTRWRGAVPGQPPPKPLVEPATLDFGDVPPNCRKRARLQVGNLGGTAQSISFAYSDEQPWFTVTKGRQVYPDRPVPLEFEVLVNTADLQPSQLYAGWVEINMDGITARAQLQLHVADPAPSPLAPRRLLLGSLLLLLLTALGVTIPSFQGVTPAATPGQRTGADALPVAQATIPVAVAAAAAGWVPIFSPDGRQLAFLSDALGTPQIYVRDAESGRLRQLTNTPEAKSAVAWSPDGNHLAYIADNAGQQLVQVAEVASGALTTLRPELPAAISRFAWAKDGQSLVIEALDNGVRRLYRANPGAGQLALLDPPPAWDTLELVSNPQ
jgi:hypothetical protein